MNTFRCELSYCNKRLNSAIELALGLCDAHIKDVADKKQYVGVCWSCSRITLIDFPNRRLKFIWKDKYLFTAACSRCTGKSEDDVAWITWSRFNPPVRWVITELGKLEQVSTQPIQKSLHQKNHEESQ